MLGRDTVATCLAHRRKVKWIPAPGWWIHDDSRPHYTAEVLYEGSWRKLGDPRSCSGLWNAPSPLVTIRRDTGEVTYPDARETARRARQFEYRER
jgi:hypothetical protein